MFDSFESFLNIRLLRDAFPPTVRKDFGHI